VSGQENRGAVHRAGLVALCGRPNVGKSTLLNALVGADLAVVSARPQTTRERMMGIWTTADFQAVLVDTPGLHAARSALNRFMVKEALMGASDVDVILMLAEIPRVPDAAAAAAWAPGPGATAALEDLARTGRPVVLVLTKADVLDEPDLVLPIIDQWQRRHPFAEVVVTSARRGQGLSALREAIVARLPEGPPLWGDALSDKDLRWHAAQLVRGELFEQLEQELPYACAVTVEAFEEGAGGDRILATVHVERESQKGIVIGRGAARLKAIGTAARRRITALTGRRCDLRLTVRVTPGWTEDPRLLERLGYTAHREDGGP
jgi:GTP-binding protein Era